MQGDKHIESSERKQDNSYIKHEKKKISRNLRDPRELRPGVLNVFLMWILSCVNIINLRLLT